MAKSWTILLRVLGTCAVLTSASRTLPGQAQESIPLILTQHLGTAGGFCKALQFPSGGSDISD